jgi:cation:H+ antiporter
VTLAWLLLQFTVCAALIARAGYLLSRSADALAEAHGWGRGWVGLALLATVTSLPELASGVSAVAWVQAPNLAVGNALGACVVNLLFLVVVDALQRKQPMYREASATHLMSAGFGVVMLGFVALGLVTGQRVPAVLHVGLYSPLLLALYFLALKAVHGQERQAVLAKRSAQAAAHAPAGAVVPGRAAVPAGAETQAGPQPQDHVEAQDQAEATAGPKAGVRREWRRFGLSAAVVLAAGSWLPGLADGLAQALGLSRSFVGTVFMALVTTLPEMAVTLGALRLGALDMALGNLLGSNLFNVTILAVDDACYVRGPLLADAAPAHAGTAVTALVMTGLLIIGLVMRPQGRALRVLSWISVGLVATFAVNAALLDLSGP